MKIALVCPYDMIGHSGGVQQIVMHQAEGLRARGHKVKIITPRPNKLKGEAPEGYIFLGNSRKIKAGLATAGDISVEIDGTEIDDVLNREEFDIINLHEPWIPVLARQITMRSNAALVGTFHANLSDSLAGKSLANMFSAYGRGIYEKMHLLTAVSESAAGILLSKLPEDELVKNIRYIPNGIDLMKYSTTPPNAIRNPSIKTILFIGRLEGRKGLKYLIRAYAELVRHRDDVQLYIAGKGQDEKKLRDYVRDNDIPRVTFIGYISDEDKIYHLHKADVFCSPAHRGESFGIVLLEAMAAGCPTVAGDNSGYSSVMKEFGAISLVNPLDIVDFARRLEIFLYEEDLRKLWLKWANKYVKQYDWKPIIDQYEDAYKEALKRQADAKEVIS
jgi:phosphatidyl-myo-inositol alpha-mannosyltransferase